MPMLQNALLTVIQFYSVLILVYCIMSWLPRGTSGIIEDIRSVLASLCEPYLGLFRRIVPTIGMIDISPIIAILVLQVLSSVIVAIL
ncbi:MAG: YggT family protein [Coriobacteriia bacterium]|nr:YggT family protein [Coriobacteriia bacterium]MBS5478721.1 YggT family protein [Coriobacteriia bacterium]